MAKFIEQKIEIIISKLFKNREETFLPVNNEQLANLEEIVSEWVVDGCIVEVSQNK